jgi:hypothetical protein
MHQPGRKIPRLDPARVVAEAIELRIGFFRNLESGVPRNQRAQSGRLDQRGSIFVERPIPISAVLRRIQLNQHLSLTNGLTVLYVNGSNDTGFEWLDGFGMTTGNNLARRHRDDIDVTERGPGHRRREHQHDGPENGTADRRRRRMLNFKHSRKKLHRTPAGNNRRGHGLFNLPCRTPHRQMSQ